MEINGKRVERSKERKKVWLWTESERKKGREGSLEKKSGKEEAEKKRKRSKREQGREGRRSR